MLDPSSCRLRLGLAFTLCLLVPWAALADADASDGEDRATIEIRSWLSAGPLDHRLPAPLGDEPDYGVAELLDEPGLRIADLRPAAGRTPAGLGADAAWRTVDGGSLPAGEGPRSVWLATWIEARRFTEATLEISGDQRFKAFVDGEEVAKRTDPEGEPAEAKLTLDTGAHLLVVRALAEGGAESWTLQAELRVDAEDALAVGTDPARGLRLDDLLDVTDYSLEGLSPDGRYLAVSASRPAVPADHAEDWIDVLDVESGDVVRTLRGGESYLVWLPPGDGEAPELAFALASAKEEKAFDVYRSPLLGGEMTRIAEGVAHLQGLVALPDGSGLIGEIGVPQEDDERDVKRYRDLPDRWSGWREPSYFVHIDFRGAIRRLTAAAQTTSFQDVRPDGGAMILSRARHGSTERPYSSTELLEIDLETLEERSLGRLGWLGDALYSPDGKTLLITGSPALFGELGQNVGDHEFANDYDTQAYLVSLDEMPIDDPASVRPITRDLDPTVRGAEWNADGYLYFLVQDRTWNRVLRLDPASESNDFVNLYAVTDTVSEMDVDGGRLAYVGSSPNRPHAVYTQSTDPGDAKRSDQQTRPLLDPSAEPLADVTYGPVEPFTFTSAAGDEILGRVYYPRDFDPSKKYPLIVYYYGGTVPVDRTFGGRYPKELWAAHGYVVYVPQPSGADGFGQEFSARHVNAWGRQTADEIIEGTRKLLAEHSFLDPERVGCTGASYGGFMTMYLQTRTDLFAAAISHAGISNLTSYWGQGWWGYLYSAAASAESFPWNRRELYVDQSPIFAADKIQTPLLLLHGDADTNVPPVESHQMYTALKILGKEVELIEIGGENHTILTYPKRKLWARTILAWFDKWLKDEPAFWEHLWGDEAEPKG